MKVSHEDIKIREVDFMQVNHTVHWYNGTPIRGVFEAEDVNDLALLNSFQSLNRVTTNLTFVPCLQRVNSSCALESDVFSFLE